VAAHPRQRRLRRPPDRGDPGPPLPRHEGDLLQRRQRLPGGRRRRSADRLRHGRRLRLRPLPRRGQGPRLRRRRRHQRRRVQRLLLARAAGDGRHGPRPRLPRRPRRSGGLRGGPPQGRPGRADRPPGDPSPGLTSDRLAVSRPDPAVGSPGAPVGAFVGLATLDLVLAVEHVPAPTRRSWRPTSSWRPAARRPTPRSPSPGPAGGRASSPCWAAIPWPRRPHRPAGQRRGRGRHRSGSRRAADRGRHPRHHGVRRRAVVSRTDRSTAGAPEAADLQLVAELLDDARIVLADGHHVALAGPLARAAQARGIPVLLDAGTWRPSFDELIPGADAVVASAAFRPPGAGPGADGVLRAILARGARFAAITAGSDPIRWRDAAGRTGSLVIPAGEVIDTLGAGDVLHGVVAAFLATEPAGVSTTDDLVAALAEGAHVASASCAYEGTRAWLAARSRGRARSLTGQPPAASRIAPPRPPRRRRGASRPARARRGRSPPTPRRGWWWPRGVGRRPPAGRSGRRGGSGSTCR